MALPINREWEWDEEDEAFVTYGSRWDYYYSPHYSSFWEEYRGSRRAAHKVHDRDHAERIICAIECCEEMKG